MIESLSFRLSSTQRMRIVIYQTQGLGFSQILRSFTLVLASRERRLILEWCQPCLLSRCTQVECPSFTSMASSSIWWLSLWTSSCSSTITRSLVLSLGPFHCSQWSTCDMVFYCICSQPVSCCRTQLLSNQWTAQMEWSQFTTLETPLRTTKHTWKVGMMTKG